MSSFVRLLDVWHLHQQYESFDNDTSSEEFEEGGRWWLAGVGMGMQGTVKKLDEAYEQCPTFHCHTPILVTLNVENPIPTQNQTIQEAR